MSHYVLLHTVPPSLQPKTSIPMVGRGILDSGQVPLLRLSTCPLSTYTLPSHANTSAEAACGSSVPTKSVHLGMHYVNLGTYPNVMKFPHSAAVSRPQWWRPHPGGGDRKLRYAMLRYAVLGYATRRSLELRFVLCCALLGLTVAQ